MQKIRLFHHFALEMFDLEIPKSNWTQAFWVISQELQFPQILDLLKHIAFTVTQTFIIDQIEKKKLNFSIHSKNLRFGLFSPFWGQNITLKKSGCHVHHHMGWHHAEFQKKLNSQSRENFQTEGRTDFIHRTLLVSQGCYKRISQLRGIALCNKNKIQYNSA